MTREHTLRQALDAAGEVIFMTDPKGVFTFVNREFERLYGYSGPEVIGRCTPRILKSGDTDAATYAEWWMRLRRGENIRQVFTNRAHDGRLVEVDTTASVIRGDLGEITGFLAVQRNVTDTIRADIALRRSEARYRALAETATDRIFIVDAKNRFEYVNSSVKRELQMTGCALGRQLRECFPEPVGAELEQLLDDFRAGPLPAYVERRVDFPTGSRWMGAWVQAIDDDGEPGQLMGIARDITTQHELAQQLERQNLLLNTMIEASSVGIILLNAERWACDISNRAVRAFGAQNLTPGTRLVDGWPEAARDLMPVVEQALRQQEPVQSRIDVLGQLPQQTRQLTVSASRLQLPNRGVSVLVMLTDVTERLQLEAQLLQAQKMEAIGRLAGGVAHDFNNLLTPILGYADLVKKTLPNDDPRHADMEEIDHAARSAGALTRQLLTFSRKQVTDATVLDLNSVLDEVVRILQRAIGEDITIVQEREPCLGAIRADRNQLEQALMNISVNARDAMPRGGTFTITTANQTIERPAQSLRGTIPPGDYVTLSLADTGTGMTPDVLSHLFEPFYTTKEFGKGTGLGLSTVYGIVTESGGYVAVTTARGQGTTFTLYFPRVGTASQAHLPLGQRAAPLPGGTETVLVVEDNDALRRLAERVLGNLGYHVLPANDAEDALRVSGEYAHAIDLLLSDIVMPGQDGLSLARRLRLNRPDIRVAFMSGYSGSDLATRDARTSALKFLQKPFTPETLAIAVRGALEMTLVQPLCKPVKPQ